MGKLGDAYGRKKIFILGLLAALLGTFTAGFAKHIGLIVGCMALIGFSSAVILPLSQALLIHQFSESQKNRGVALWSMIISLSLAAGPLVGGFILNWLNWRWCYWIDVPIIFLALLIVFYCVDGKQEKRPFQFQWLESLLIVILIATLVTAIMQGPLWGWSSWRILSLSALFALSLALFIAKEMKSETPLFRPDLFANRSFLCSSLANGCTIGFNWTIFFIIPLYLQNYLLRTPFETGLILLLITLPVLFFTTPILHLANKWGTKRLMLFGFTLFLLAFLSQLLLVPTLWTVAFGCLLIGFSWVIVWGPSISTALATIPHYLTGLASGMFTTLQELGGVVCLAISGVFFRYKLDQRLLSERSQIDEALHHPAELESLLSNPAAVQAQLGPDAPILTSLKEAFLAGYENTFLFLFLLCLCALLLTSFLPKMGPFTHKRQSLN